MDGDSFQEAQAKNVWEATLGRRLHRPVPALPLSPPEWIDNVYLPTNHSRLREAHEYVTKKLKALEIPFLNRGSGLYVWVNLRSVSSGSQDGRSRADLSDGPGLSRSSAFASTWSRAHLKKSCRSIAASWTTS